MPKQVIITAPVHPYLLETLSSNGFDCVYEPSISYDALSEKIAIVIGMFSFGFINELTGSQRNSVLVLGSFFVIGFILLYRTAQYQKNATA